MTGGFRVRTTQKGLPPRNDHNLKFPIPSDLLELFSLPCKAFQTSKKARVPVGTETRKKGLDNTQKTCYTYFCVSGKAFRTRCGPRAGREEKMKQNITLSIEKDILKKGRIIAAKKETSISRMLSELLKQMVNEEERYNAAKREALRTLEKGLHLGGHIDWKREDLYER